MSVCILNYGRELPKAHHGFKALYYTDHDNVHNQRADTLWKTATFVSEHHWQRPDIVCDLSIGSVTPADKTYDLIFSMPPSNSLLYLYPHFWAEISKWLAPGGFFFAISEDKLINGYLCEKLNKYTTYYKLCQYMYDRMTLNEQTEISQSFELLRADIMAWSSNRLSVVRNIYDEVVLDPTDSHRCLVFQRTFTS